MSTADPRALVEFVIKGLVEQPEAVRVRASERARMVVIEVKVAPDDVGKVIGKQGRIARALRSIVRASGARAEERYLLEIAD